MQVWNVLHAARWKCRTQKSPKIRHLGTIAHLCGAISSQVSHVFYQSSLWLLHFNKLLHMYRQSEKLVKQQYICPTCPHNMVDFGLLTAEIRSGVWGTPANFNGFHVLAALLHGTLVVGVSQTLRCWTEDDTYIRQGGHHVRHWPTF